MRILVYGAGVLGSLLAARLKEAGQEVTLLARGQRLAELREHGIVIEDALAGTRRSIQVELADRLKPEDAYDWVLVVARRNRIPEILPALAANANTPDVLFIGNNAAGPDEYVRALGERRVLMGFLSAGGVREGHIVRTVMQVAGQKARVTIGEVDGQYTYRMRQIADILEAAGFRVDLSNNIDAWLTTHAAFVTPLALAVYMAGGDNYRLARTRDALVLAIRAVREGFQVLDALNIPVLPSRLRVYQWLPEPLLVPLAARLLGSRSAEIGVAGHANAARDEMRTLADQLYSLVHKTNVPTPALDQLYAYLNPDVPAVAEGSARLSLDWRSIWVVLGTFAGVLAFARLARGKSSSS